MDTLERRFEAVQKSCSEAIDMVNDLLADTDCPEDTTDVIDVVIDEITDNIVSYAFAGNEFRQEDKAFTVRAAIMENMIQLEFSYAGVLFDPLKAEAVDLSDGDRIGGLGIHLMKNMTDEISYDNYRGQNRLTVCKSWN